MDRILFGTAYYDEYMPEDRLDKDIELMLKAGINTVRIGESTWSTIERRPGVYDFSSLDRVVDSMEKAGIAVIVGTATYAVPAWLAASHPDVLVQTPEGRRKFGPRQNMDITHPVFRSRAEKIIRRVTERFAPRKCVIGFQADNETKHYRNFGSAVQKAFVESLKSRFGDMEKLNAAFGLDYWSNRINSWEEFPPVDETINASLGCAFAAFQRQLVTDYLAWQVSIINEYKRDDQFVTHNFDFEWRGHSFGVQPDVDHDKASEAFDIVGVDVYHPSQDQLTGAEISFCGDLARSLKKSNYLVLETQAQGFPEWLPYPGQLRLQAFSHIASGAAMVEYWHWHSIHNAIETYWKGLLSHDMEPNPLYEEAAAIGADLKRIGRRLTGLRKTNRAAVLVSNEALSAFDSFKRVFSGLSYNDVFRLLYDSLYRLNVETDIVFPGNLDLSSYKILFVPALYAAGDSLLRLLNDFVREGGRIVYTFMSGFSDENVKVRAKKQPGVIAEACGIRCSRFTKGQGIALAGDPFAVGSADNRIEGWMELAETEGAEVMARYDHPHWGNNAAVTLNTFGGGQAAYIACLTSAPLMTGILRELLDRMGIRNKSDALEFPLIRKTGMTPGGKFLSFYLNYSGFSAAAAYEGREGTELISGAKIAAGTRLELGAWDCRIIAEEA